MKKTLSLVLSLILIFSMLFVNGSFVIDVFAEEVYYGLFSDETSDGGFEYGGWKSYSVPSNASWQVMSTDSFRGQNCAGFSFGTSGGYKEIYICMDVPAETVKKIKTYKNYCWTSYIKTTTNFMGSVSFKIVPFGDYANEGFANISNQNEVQLYSHALGRPTVWTRFAEEDSYYQSHSIAQFLSDKTTFSVVMKVRGARGTIWIDDVNLKRVDMLDMDDSVEEPPTYGDFEGNLNNFSFENGNWIVKNKEDQEVTLDTANGHGGSNTALKVQMFERKATYANAINFTTSTISGVANELDTTKNYRTAIWVKTSEDFIGSISFQVWQNGSKKWYNWETELHLIGNSNTAASGYSNWTYLYTPNFAVTNHDITVTLIVNGVGTIWFDNAQIILDPEADNIISNGGFESGAWSTWGSDELATETVSVDTKVTCGSAKSCKISVTDATNAGVFIVGGFDLSKFNPNKTHDLSFDIKYSNVSETDGVRCAILQWYNIENADGTISNVSRWYRYNGSEQLLNTGGGSKDWTEYKFSLSSYGWSENLTNIVIYFYLYDKGELWIDNVSLTERKPNLNIADGVVASDTPNGDLIAGDCVQLYTKSSTEDIWYTVDGSDPRISKTAYLYKDGMGILVTEDLTIKASAKNVETGFGVVSTFNYTCPNMLISEDTLWSTVNVSGAATLDSSVKKVGDNSIKLTGSSNNRYVSTGKIPITSAFDYKLSFWLKTENLASDSAADVNVFLVTPVGGGNQGHPFLSGVVGASVGNYGESYFKIKANQDWTYYELDLHTLNGVFSDVTVTLYNNKGYGNIWIDGVTLVSVPKANYPLRVEYDNKVQGNIYPHSTSSDFVIEQSFNIDNKAKSNETGIMHYEVINDSEPDKILTSGEIEINIASDTEISSSIDLSAINKYGTYTVNFTMENTQGAVYNAGSISLSRLIDNTYLMENGGTYLGVCGSVSNTKLANLHNYVGNSMMRFDYDWLDVEKQKGVYTIHETKDSWINTMLENNIEPLIIFNDHGWPSWMEQIGWPTTESDLEHFLGYVKFLVETYKGKVKYFEFYNEVDYRHWADPSMYPDAAGYTKTMKEVYRVVKEANPEAILIGGVTASTGVSGVNFGWAQGMFENGAADYMDYYSIHPYVQLYDSPENGKWLEDIQKLNNNIKQIIGREFPLFITEMNWATSRTADQGETPALQAAFSVRQYTMAKSLGNLEKVVTYCTESGNDIYSTENQFGMFLGNTARPLAVARAAFNHMHNGFEYDSTLNLADGLYTYKFTSETEEMYVLWVNRTEKLLRITTSSNDALVYDIFGNSVDIEYLENSFETLVSDNLIYIKVSKGEKIENVSVTVKPQEVLNDTILSNASFETKPIFWANDAMGSMDKLERYDGKASLKISFTKGSNDSATFVLGGLSEKLAGLDSSINYKLRFYVKSDGAFDGTLIIDPRYYSNGKEYFGCYWLWGQDYPIINTGTISTEWTQYETQPFPIFADNLTMLVSVNNKVALSDAAVWFDRFEIVPVEENTTNGTISVKYDEELNKVIATVKGKDGYMPTSLIARGATGYGVNDYQTVSCTYYQQTDINEVSYIVDFGSCNRYYQGQNFKLFEATYTTFSTEGGGLMIMGDATGDGKVDIRDLVRFKNYQLGNTYDIKFYSVWFDRTDYSLGATDFTELKKIIWHRFK